jgi:ABC-type iron transport system FetAB ATPase subunit
VSGPSGAGKTLLLRALADLDPHEGEVRLDGVATRRIPPPVWRRRVGLLAAESAWWGERVRDHFQGDPTAGLERLGLPTAALDWEVRRLSTGERQRLALLRLLENRPEVLLLDEPTANLDDAGRACVEALIRDYREAGGAAVVWVAHDAGQLARVATHWLRMDAGRLITVATQARGCT